MPEGLLHPDGIGLCAKCRYARTVKHPRGGEDYYRCGKHDEDPTYPKYPPLPVRECAAFESSAEPGRL